VQITSHAFKDQSTRALSSAELQKALSHVESGFIGKRAKAAAALPEFEALRDQARDIKNHTFAS